MAALMTYNMLFEVIEVKEVNASLEVIDDSWVICS